MSLNELRKNEARVKELLNRPWKMLIGGELTEALGRERFDTFSPATGEFLATVPFAQREDVNRAVKTAEQAFPSWRETPVLERVNAVRRFISVLKENAYDLGLLDAIDGGSPVTAMVGDVRLACLMLEYACSAAMEVKGQTIPATSGNWQLIKDIFPAGVVNILTGDGPTTGDALVRHPRVKRIALTGSVETG